MKANFERYRGWWSKLDSFWEREREKEACLNKEETLVFASINYLWVLAHRQRYQRDEIHIYFSNGRALFYIMNSPRATDSLLSAAKDRNALCAFNLCRKAFCKSPATRAFISTCFSLNIISTLFLGGAGGNFALCLEKFSQNFLWLFSLQCHLWDIVNTLQRR